MFSKLTQRSRKLHTGGPSTNNHKIHQTVELYFIFNLKCFFKVCQDCIAPRECIFYRPNGNRLLLYFGVAIEVRNGASSHHEIVIIEISDGSFKDLLVSVNANGISKPEV